ncbi:MAG: acyl-CoA thioesterase [bacterium]|nr:acyl-CoA thioesterase [bacterium]
MPQPTRYEFSTPIRVAWGDMDALRHVNNVSYTRYFETARAEFFVYLRERFGHKPPDNQILILTKLEFNYRGQVFFPANLEVTCGIPKLSGRTLLLGCSMWNEEGQCVADGISHHMWIDVDSGRAIRMPQEFDPVYQAYLQGELR